MDLTTKREQFNDLYGRMMSKEISFDQFIVETRSDWRRIAASIFARYSIPTAYGLEDAYQDLVVGVWKYTLKFDPAVSDNFHAYVASMASLYLRDCINAVRLGGTRKKTVVQGWRIVPAAKAKSQIFICLESAPVEQTDGQYERLESLEYAIRLCRSPKERLVLETLVSAGGDVDAVAKRLDGRMTRSVVIATMRTLTARIEARNG